MLFYDRKIMIFTYDNKKEENGSIDCNNQEHRV